MTDEERTTAAIAQAREQYMAMQADSAHINWERAERAEKREREHAAMLAASVEVDTRQAVALERINKVLGRIAETLERAVVVEDAPKPKPPATPPTPPPAGGHK